MIAIAVYDKMIDVENPRPGYPPIKKHSFNKVWLIQEDGTLKTLNNVLANPGAKSTSRLNNKFQFESKRIYLIKYSDISDGNTFKNAEAIDRCGIFEYDNNDYKVFIPSSCQNLYLKSDYIKNRVLFNNFLVAQFKNQDVCDFTKFILMRVSKKENLNLENLNIIELYKFNSDVYLRKKIKENSKVTKVVETVKFRQTSLFDGMEEFEMPKEKEEVITLSEILGDSVKLEIKKIESQTPTKMLNLNEVIKLSNINTIKTKEVKMEKQNTTEMADKKIKRIRWKNDDVSFLVNNHETLSIEEIATHVGRNVESVKGKIRSLVAIGTISKEEDKAIIKFEDVSITPEKIVVKKHKWTNEDKEFLKNNYKEHGGLYCAEHLGVSHKKVTDMAYILKVNKKNKPAEVIKEIVAPTPEPVKISIHDEVAEEVVFRQEANRPVTTVVEKKSWFKRLFGIK